MYEQEYGQKISGRDSFRNIGVLLGCLRRKGEFVVFR